MTATYPDKTQKTAQCVLVGGVWVGTIEGSPTAGSCTNGYTVIADSIDENGNPVNGYVLGRGDVEILKEDGTPIEDPTHFVTDDELDTAISSKAEISAVEEVAEDVANLANSLSDYYTKSETSSAVELDAKFETKADLSTLNEVADSLSGYYTKSETSSATELQTAFNNVSVDLSEYYTKSETSSTTEISIALDLKQDKLADGQLYAINSTEQQYKTFVTYRDSTVSSYDIYGTLSQSDIAVDGKEIMTVNVGKGVTSIGSFKYCTTLYEITIADTVKHIERFAFNGCTGLTNVQLPKDIQLDYYAFGDCANLRKITLPDGLFTDGGGELAGSGIQDVIVENVRYLTPTMFYNCPNLNTVVFKGKTMAEVQAMADYPWDIKDTSIIKTWNDASKEYVDETLSAYQKLRPATETISANQSSLNWNLANPYVTYILTTNTGYYTSFQFTVDLTQMCNNYPDDVNGEAFIDANNFVAIEDGHIDFTTSNSRFTVEYETDYDQSIKSGHMYLFKFRQIGQRILVSCEMFGNAE